MFKFDNVYTTTKKSHWVNTCQYIIIHHTGWWTYLSNCKYLSVGSSPASVHFVVWENGEVAKIWDPRWILRHAWQSEWWALKWMNSYSLGIEVVWPNKEWKFSDAQYIKLVELIKYLMEHFKIPVEKVLKHADIAWVWAKQEKLRDWKTPARKVDIKSTLWRDRWYQNFAEWRQKVLK